jgi:hypothetical protein
MALIESSPFAKAVLIRARQLRGIPQAFFRIRPGSRRDPQVNATDGAGMCPRHHTAVHILSRL